MSIFKKYDAGKGKRQPGQNGDCQVRALITASGMGYAEAWDVLYRLQGKYRTCGFDLCYYLERGELGAGKTMSFPAERGKSRMTAGEFAEKHPKGSYVLRQAHHVVAVEDGIVYDTFDCTDRCVFRAWRTA